MEIITDMDYKHMQKKVLKNFEIKTLGEYEDLYVHYIQSIHFY